LDRREIVAFTDGSTRETCGLLQEYARLARIDSSLIVGLRVRRTVRCTVRVRDALYLNHLYELHTFRDERKCGPKSGSRTVTTPLARVARIPPGPGVATVLLIETLEFIEEKDGWIITRALRK
jgi:hypothetical protein